MHFIYSCQIIEPLVNDDDDDDDKCDDNDDHDDRRGTRAGKAEITLHLAPGLRLPGNDASQVRMMMMLMMIIMMI